MSYHEQKSIVSIISTVLIFIFYALYVLQKYPEKFPPTAADPGFWAAVILILIPISTAAKIIISIIFHSIYRTMAGEEEPSFSDERDRLIELKATRISHWIFVFGFLLAMGALVLKMPISIMFLIFIFSGLISDLSGEISQIYFYRRGTS